MRSRRTFLSLAGATLAVAALPSVARAADGSFDISYLWARKLDDLLDYREVVADLLGAEVARELIVVRGGSGNWGLLLDRTDRSEAAAKALAGKHHRTLKHALGGREVLATALPDRGYDRTWHVRYGVHNSDEAARESFEQVAETLRDEVAAELQVEKAAKGRWHVVYHRFGDRSSTERLADKHGRALSRYGIVPDVVSDRFLDPRWAVQCVDDETPAALVAGAAGTTTRRITRHGPPIVSAEPGQRRDVTPREAARVAAEPRVEPTRKVAQSSVDADVLPAAIQTPLRNAINRHIQTLRRKGVIERDETTSWYVHTLHDDRTWAAINAERKLQCASMFKPYVALAFLHRAKQGRIIYGPLSKSKLESMIQHSNNEATNWAMEKVGGPSGVQRILREVYGEIFEETSIVEWIPRNGRTYRNRSSARDYIRFSRALWRGDLPYSAEIRRLMALPGRDRLATGAPSIPATTKVMNKTGTTSHLCGDFGILVARDNGGREIPYAIAGIIEKRSRARSFAAWTASRARVIRGVSNLAYLELGKHYRLG